MLCRSPCALCSRRKKESAAPLAEEDAQVERARVQHQPGVIAQLQVLIKAKMLMHRIFIAGDAFRFAHRLQRRQQLAKLRLQRLRLLADARCAQLRFADAHQRSQLAGIFFRMTAFQRLVVLPQ